MKAKLICWMVGLVISVTGYAVGDQYTFAAWHPDWQWTWADGPAITDQLGVYGEQGVPAASNMPGARIRTACCRADAVRIWVFGGDGYSALGPGVLSDLWCYDAATGYWKWLNSFYNSDQNGIYGEQGVPASTNMPGGRERAVLWPDGAGGLWLLGGLGRASSGGNAPLNDLWHFDVASSNWTWVKGAHSNNQLGVYGAQGAPHALNFPGARYDASGWSDTNGNLWLFGGQGRDSVGSLNLLNDLWRFDPSTTNWVWVKGASTVQQNGVYGTMGVPAPENTPGARLAATVCSDADGMFWLFGGYGLGAAGTSDRLNDLWRFDPVTENWTWIKGDTVTNRHGVYGVSGQGASSNTPGSRSEAVMWPHPSGGLWLFGGYGLAAAGDNGRLNDFWRFDPAVSNWIWTKGTSITNHPGTHGTVGIPSEHNLIGARNNAVGWVDDAGAIWMFGGYGMDDSGYWGRFNDVWRYPQTYTVTFQTDGTAGASLAGNTNQAVMLGNNCTAVTAQPPVTHHFVRWTTAGAEDSIVNPLCVSNVINNMAFTAHFALSQ